ncbi:holin family protein [Sporosarcina sp. Marseille-Q4943]|uniref:phage holin family protein n=1 Tax=Sporosarcina sp. Marseille-Q4943 TaxID=2942204 RepID=UPI00208DD47D|nr:phage holin family protein [Sporosarcina sp. Marseille-Q4943]
MKNETNTLYTFITGGGLSTVAYLLGGLDNLIIALAIFMVCDFILGAAAGANNEGLNSKRALKGLGKKGAMISLVVVANQLDIISGSDTGFVRNSMIFFLIGTEGISLVENMGRLGLNVPDFIRTRFEQMKNDEKVDKDVH